MRIFKKLIYSCALSAFALTSINANAESIDANAAQAAAGKFLQKNMPAKLRSSATPSIKLAYTEKSSVQANAYYVFNIDGGGWVVIAGDDRAHQVLAYGTEGSIDMNTIPQCTKDYLNMFKKQIETIQKDNVQVKPIKSATRRTPIGPLLPSINWAQQGPFNWECPSYGGERSSVGCGALAMSQVVNYWKYPVEMPALSGYQNAYYYTQVPSLPARTMDYSLIRNQYTYFNEEGKLSLVEGVTNEECEEVAWLCRYCAQACVMNFSPDGSGSNVMKQKKAFDALGYSSETKLLGREAWPTRETWNTTDYTHEEWVELINAQLEALHPIPYSSEDIGDGHAFVIDGVDAEGLYHVSWGWYGRGDGWFQYGAFNVTVQNQYMEWNDALFMVADLYPYEGYVIPGDTTYEVGDVDQSGVIDIDDITALTAYVLNPAGSTIDVTLANFNGEGAIDIDDVVALIARVLGTK